MAHHALSDLLRELHDIAPLALAEEWDNVGLLIAPPSGSAEAHPLDGPVLLTIDLSEPVADEAVRLGASAIVAYHPPIFRPLKRLTGSTSSERIAMRLLSARSGRGIPVYSPHTALDSAHGGISDYLADILLDLKDKGVASEHGTKPGAHVGGDRRSLAPSRITEGGADNVKVVTFVPHDAAPRIRDALGSIGAGQIGNYRLCSFSAPGTGTFFGDEGTNPAKGKSGRLEEVPELRLEMVCPARALPLAIEMLRQFHPYEEPAFDVYPLAPVPMRNSGSGRRITFDHPLSLAELAARIKRHLDLPVVHIAPAESAGAGEGAKPERILVKRTALCPGSGGGLLDAAIAEECDCFITGEMKHHDVRHAASSGVSVILTGHTQSERPYLRVLAERLASRLPRARFEPSKADRPPETAI